METTKHKSIRDIANDLHVAISTVSAVLNGKAAERRISEKTVERILSYATACGYQPNQVARSLRTGESRIIGMLVEDMANPFFAEIAKRVEKILFREHYKLFCSSTENDPQKALALLMAYQERQVDGYIIAPMPEMESFITKLIQWEFPVVLFDSYISTARKNSVIIDNFGGTYQATRHLLANGYRNIAFVTVDTLLTHLEDRMRGYVTAMQEQQLNLRTAAIQHNRQPQSKKAEIAAFLTADCAIEAVIFSTNYLAITGLQALKELHKIIPKDIAVVSFDDNDYFKLITPEITVIAQPMEEFAEEITRKLLNDIQNKQGEKSEIVLKTSLIVRDSSLPDHLSNQIPAFKEGPVSGSESGI